MYDTLPTPIQNPKTRSNEIFQKHDERVASTATRNGDVYKGGKVVKPASKGNMT